MWPKELEEGLKRNNDSTGIQYWYCLLLIRLHLAGTIVALCSSFVSKHVKNVKSNLLALEIDKQLEELEWHLMGVILLLESVGWWQGSKDMVLPLGDLDGLLILASQVC